MLRGSGWDSFIVMQQHCHRCGGELSEGDEVTSFCPHCGAPQLYLPEYDRPSVAAELDSTGAPPPPHPQVVDWKTAIRCAAVVAGIAAALTVLAMGLPGIPAAGDDWDLLDVDGGDDCGGFLSAAASAGEDGRSRGGADRVYDGVGAGGVYHGCDGGGGGGGAVRTALDGGVRCADYEQLAELVRQTTAQASHSAAAGTPELAGVCAVYGYAGVSSWLCAGDGCFQFGGSAGFFYAGWGCGGTVPDAAAGCAVKMVGRAFHWGGG